MRDDCGPRYHLLVTPENPSQEAALTMTLEAWNYSRGDLWDHLRMRYTLFLTRRSFFFTLQGEKGGKGDPGPMGLPVRIFSPDYTHTHTHKYTHIHAHILIGTRAHSHTYTRSLKHAFKHGYRTRRDKRWKSERPRSTVFGKPGPFFREICSRKIRRASADLKRGDYAL